MRYMCGKYPHLKEAIENAWTSGTRWDDIVNMVMTLRDASTNPRDSLSGEVHLDPELTGQTLSGTLSMTRVNKRGRDDVEGSTTDAEFTEDLIMHQELLSEDHVFWATFSVNFKVLMPQKNEISVMLKYVNTVFDMKRAISCETGIPITDFYLLNGVKVMHDDDTLLKSRVSPRVGVQLCFRLRGGKSYTE